jgi:hypothetical protein
MRSPDVAQLTTRARQPPAPDCEEIGRADEQQRTALVALQAAIRALPHEASESAC